MASDKEDFVYFITGDEELGSPSFLKPNFGGNNSDSEHEFDNAADTDQPASAVNPETGEINWDCPCLKSALEPPCGHTFKAAFSCFVASKTEPKGMDCHELFKTMQECFRAHPEKYGAILEDDDGDDFEADSEDANSIGTGLSELELKEKNPDLFNVKSI